MTLGACVLVLDSAGRILAISRPGDAADFGLLGGSVDPEDGDLERDRLGALRRAAAREAWEEAGIEVDPGDLELVYEAPARRRIAVTFLARRFRGEPRLGPGPEGVVAWVEPAEVCRGSFGDYNRGLLERLGIYP